MTLMFICFISSLENSVEVAIHDNERRSVGQIGETPRQLYCFITCFNLIYLFLLGQHIVGSVTNETLLSNPSPPPPHPPPHGNDHHSSTSPVYQPLNTATTDYTSVYATPTSAGRRGTPLVEVEGKMYSIVDQTTRKDEHNYTTPQLH